MYTKHIQKQKGGRYCMKLFQVDIDDLIFDYDAYHSSEDDMVSDR